MSSIAANLAALRARAGNATLIAVSKTHGITAVREALAAGQRVFGENRVQEAQGKFPDLRRTYPDIELHLIGTLQSNKAQAAVALFDVIQTLDRPALAEALAQAIQKTGRRPRIYIEVNIGNEPQKAGIAPDQTESFLASCRQIGLQISGLMCIPPQGQDPTPYFLRTHELQERLALPHLSMGMSQDFKIALACGATEIRIGTAIFGARE
ncbi:MAG: YggS family pyridoxal phosphate-dependent enzyme [Alphaproteobacteria bacterium]|nr:YggS family pyridoxal phosphate-dependent enzyme [Alphaproteobacteria bacterium]